MHRKLIIILLLIFVSILSVIFINFINKPLKVVPQAQEIHTTDLVQNTPNAFVSFEYDVKQEVASVDTDSEKIVKQFLVQYEKKPTKKVQEAYSLSTSNTTTNKATSLSFPQGFVANLKKTREESDSKLIYDLVSEQNNHYFYKQYISVGDTSYPVYGTQLRVDITDSKKISGVSGAYLKNTNVISGDISSNYAKAIALEKAKLDGAKNEMFLCSNAEKIIINPKFINASDDTNSYLTYKIDICSKNTFFKYSYFISLLDGKILYVENNIQDSRYREVRKCESYFFGLFDKCKTQIHENFSISSDNLAENLFSYLGTTYDYFHNTFKRDSYNGRGGKLLASIVDISDVGCPNAFWNSREGMGFCSSTVLLDIVAHEFTHGFTEQSSGLIYNRQQQGALNEAISDIFAYAVDSDDWVLGDTVAFRYINNPSLKSRPDKLSSGFYINGDSDPHHNMSVITYAFYLMVSGGSFNGCTIEGTSLDDVMKVIYRAQTVYLRPTSDFNHFYTAVNDSCRDIFGQTSSKCINIAKAMQATEINQSFPIQTATCAFSNPIPTNRIDVTTVPTNRIHITNTPTEVSGSICKVDKAPCQDVYIKQCRIDTANTGYKKCYKKGICNGVGDGTKCSWGTGSYCEDCKICAQIEQKCEDHYSEKCSINGKTGTKKCHKYGKCTGIGSGENCDWGTGSYCENCIVN